MLIMIPVKENWKLQVVVWLPYNHDSRFIHCEKNFDIFSIHIHYTLYSIHVHLREMHWFLLMYCITIYTLYRWYDALLSFHSYHINYQNYRKFKTYHNSFCIKILWWVSEMLIINPRKLNAPATQSSVSI